MSGIRNLYTGRAGHLAVMAEFLIRGWNTAIPEVDVGDDIFVVRDSDGNLRRVQVKTATAESQEDGHKAKFNVPLSQLRTPRSPDITYVFAVRLCDSWDTFVVMDREALDEENQLYNIGYDLKGGLMLELNFEGASITCDGHDLSQYRNNWDKRFPVVEH